jgi:spore maturation protein CgeB
MRIFLTLSPSGNRSVPGSMTWYRNLYEPLLDLGNDVYLLRIDESEDKLGVNRRAEPFLGKFSQYLLNTFQEENRKKQFDLFFSYFIDSDIETSCIDEIKKSGAITTNFSCNNIHQFYLTEKIAPHFDYNLHSEKYAAEKFKAIGANPIWFQMAANPKYYHPLGIDRTLDVSFIGGAYAKRPYYIYNLLENGIDVHAYGPGWRKTEHLANLRRIKRELIRSKEMIRSIFTFSPQIRAEISSRVADMDFKDNLLAKYIRNLHFPITDEEMIRKYNESKISLGFLEVYDNHDHSQKTTHHLHLREFEAPMCGALYFTNYSDELAEHYEPDREVIIYRNEHELLDKVNYYLDHPKEAEKVRQAGHRRALECHTYQKRFADLFDNIFKGNV